MISLIISTYNGERTLRKTLLALSNVTPPLTGVEFLIVDNGSTDSTRSLLDEARGFIDLTILEQPLRGKNRALNLAASIAQGDLVVFTDDDVIPDPDWLITLEAAALKHSHADIFGGTIFPVWEKPPPDWVLTAVPKGITFAITSNNLTDGPVHPGLIWGPNMMVRRRIFDLGFRFNEAVGPNIGQYIMGSETEFNLRVAAAGHSTWFCPSARVGHIIRDFQTTENWVIRRAYRFGRNKCYQDLTGFIDRNCKDDNNETPRFPKWMIKKSATETLLAIAKQLIGKKTESIAHKWEASFLRGYIAQAMDIHAKRSIDYFHRD